MKTPPYEGNRNQQHSLGQPQGLAVEQFFYFFLSLRKHEIRRTIDQLRARFPGDDDYTLAERLVKAKLGLSILGGGLMQAPSLIPGLGRVLTLTGIASGGALLSRLHLYLILEIACLFGEDIDDSARVPEMLAVVAATGLGAASPALLQCLELDPRYSLPAGALGMGALTALIGQSAIRFYGGARPRQVPLASSAG